MAWAAIWQDGRSQSLDGFLAFRGDPEAPLPALTLWTEMAIPRLRRKPLRLWQGQSYRGIEIYLLPDGSLRLIHGDLDLSTPPRFLAPGQVLNLRYVCCPNGRSDVFDVQNTDTGIRYRIRAGFALEPRLHDAMPLVQGFSDIAHVAAIATHAIPAGGLPGLESGALIATPDGARPIEEIRPGMSVLADDGLCHVARWAEARDRLCLGRDAPVLLRAPYFGVEADTCVTPETRLVRHGPDVEYLIGTDSVLVRAADLASGPGARFDRRRPLRRFHHLMLDDAARLMVWRCRIETAFLGEVLATEDSGGSAARPTEKDCVSSLPLLDRASARSLLPRPPGAQNFVP